MKKKSNPSEEKPVSPPFSENNSFENNENKAHTSEQKKMKYWKSLPFQQPPSAPQPTPHDEFPPAPSKLSLGQWERRDFLKLMGASLALGTVGCFRRPVETIVPYVKEPEQTTLGLPTFYTSTWSDEAESFGILVKTRESRPLKVEGNPLHPDNRGALSARAQAHLLALYDPERFKGPRKNLFNKTRTNKDQVSVEWDPVDDTLVEQIKKGSCVILTGPNRSPSHQQIVDDFCSAFGARWIRWQPLKNEWHKYAQKKCYAPVVEWQPHFDKSELTLAFESDFLGTQGNSVASAVRFAQARRPSSKMTRLVVFESLFTLTGANADDRYAIKTFEAPLLVWSLIAILLKEHRISQYAGNAKLISQLPDLNSATIQPWLKVLRPLATELVAKMGQSLVVGGEQAWSEWGFSLSVGVQLLNHILENPQKTLTPRTTSPLAPRPASDWNEIVDLVKQMNEGQVKTLIIHNTNPLFTFPKELGFLEALKKVDLSVSTSPLPDETSEWVDYILPDHHPLESWGDTWFPSGTLSLQQPVLKPLYDTRSFEFTLMTWAYYANQGPSRLKDLESWHDYLTQFWQNRVRPKDPWVGTEFKDYWHQSLQKGFVSVMKQTAAVPSFQLDAALLALAKTPENRPLELCLYPSSALHSGTLANVSWLQELPDPINKTCWGNPVSMSPETAKILNVQQEQVLRLEANGHSIEAPVLIQPGLAEGVLNLAVGYGHQQGKVAKGIGADAFPLVSVGSEGPRYSNLTVKVKVTSKTEPVTQTQEHHSMEGRQIIAQTSLASFLKNPSSGIHRHKTWTMWAGHNYEGYRWGMAIDLSRCIGCNACVVACQAENNIPVVGPEYVREGREMHWIRVDRYFAGASHTELAKPSVKTAFQPVTCQHCENAPCETVCPVLATVHTDEGLNDMVYNRCVGTRYCANNCPYKVRRFNWFNYAKNIESPLNLQLNPDVMVRTRGVMEKCTFCNHRIKEAKVQARLENRKLNEIEVQPACATTCPTQAIVFGDLNNSNSQVAKIFKDPRAYTLLEEWNAAPSIRYLSKVDHSTSLQEEEPHA